MEKTGVLWAEKSVDTKLPENLSLIKRIEDDITNSILHRIAQSLKDEREYFVRLSDIFCRKDEEGYKVIERSAVVLLMDMEEAEVGDYVRRTDVEQEEDWRLLQGKEGLFTVTTLFPGGGKPIEVWERVK